MCQQSGLAACSIALLQIEAYTVIAGRQAGKQGRPEFLVVASVLDLTELQDSNS
jgi:hypothetical protein